MSAFAALADTLRDVANAIRPLSDEEFTARVLMSSGSVGAHVRHCLDHAWALERGIATGEVCYDHRERDTVVERERSLALSRLQRAAARLGGIDGVRLDRPLVLGVQLQADGPTIHVPTTVGRELAFGISHTIHHSAMIAALLEHGDHDVPPRFGLAPTTPALSDPICAQ